MFIFSISIPKANDIGPRVERTPGQNPQDSTHRNPEAHYPHPIQSKFRSYMGLCQRSHHLCRRAARCPAWEAVTGQGMSGNLGPTICRSDRTCRGCSKYIFDDRRIIFLLHEGDETAYGSQGKVAEAPLVAECSDAAIPGSSVLGAVGHDASYRKA
ncbi:hypothetical protein DAEQUDRAFT_720716 [Daedalea quercina L-15889]|uniref:Uncharacterized protein n=1 Tax=Daedalea quercina L-15889 TaxID=1314783 RepID=A0A165U877_9APHY|nr:hypothetical protein DAEQUDRAFT_720716 [Daedalea quercina L-15889]